MLKEFRMLMSVLKMMVLATFLAVFVYLSFLYLQFNYVLVRLR